MELEQPASRLCFVDIDVLVAFRDTSNRVRQRRASGWLEELWATRTGRLSIQVLNEYFAVATEGFRPGLQRAQARADVQNLLAWNPVPVDRQVVERAWDVQERHKLSWRDSLIVSAAQIAGCRGLLTDELTDGRQFDDLLVLSYTRVGSRQQLAFASR
jgi:predicted nucleic acid-binding protein